MVELFCTVSSTGWPDRHACNDIIMNNKACNVNEKIEDHGFEKGYLLESAELLGYSSRGWGNSVIFVFLTRATGFFYSPTLVQ